MAGRDPKNRTILIGVDDERNFYYTDLFDETDAHTLKLINGDMLAWVLDPSISPRTFQIDFGVVNPFHIGVPVSLRGIDYVVSPKVKFRNTYQGNRHLKYTVTLGNGWVDDPDVVPVPEDATLGGLITPPHCDIFWTTPDEIAIDIDPKDLSIQSGGNPPLAEMVWRWRSDQVDIQPFTLEFAPDPGQLLPSGWPQGEQESSGYGHPTIDLFLPPGMATPTPFRIRTTTPDGMEVQKDGTLLVT